MGEITIYCSARDQEVSVVVDHDPLYDGESSVFESTLYCLEIGHSCTGTTCPLGAEPPTALDPAWLAHLGSSAHSDSRRSSWRGASQGGVT